MNQTLDAFEQRLAKLPVTVAIDLPSGQHIGPAQSDVHITIKSAAAYLALAQGQIGSLASAVVEGWVDFQGNMRNVMAASAALLQEDPVAADLKPGNWWQHTKQRVASLALHTLERDAQQIQFHYDLSDEFYQLWLDPQRVYSCAYYASPEMTLAQAQDSKLDHICRKLQLQRGERLLDIGSGWGGLILWAAKHYGVRAKGITLSKNQYQYVTQLIADQGLKGQVEVALCDYRKVSDEPFDKISSVGMFEHVGRANLPAYFQTVHSLLKPGGMALIHGITAGGTQNSQLGAGIGDFIEKYIFPGGELIHISAILNDMADAGLEMVDTENLRPHYARTLWAWSDNLEAKLNQAQDLLVQQKGQETAEKAIRAYRLYLAGSAMGFERGWMALHQMLCIRPDGEMATGTMTGAQSAYPFNRSYIYNN